MKRQARECYLVRLQRYGEDPETIMGSWHPDFRELMKRLRDRQLTLMARLTVLEVDVYNVLNGKLDELEREFGPVESGMVSCSAGRGTSTGTWCSTRRPCPSPAAAPWPAGKRGATREKRKPPPVRRRFLILSSINPQDEPLAAAPVPSL